MKKLRTKKRINNKKGISMVLAIALVAVLFLTTTSFLSIAMLQQSETGTTLNSRQAYVSSKSALDMAQEFLNDGKLTLPSASGASLYYVFYYDSTGNVHKQQFASVADANTWMKNNSGFTIIGDAYVKVIKNPDGSYTMTAVGKEDKYNDTNGGNTGDISVKFDVNYSLSVKETNKVLTMDQKIISNPPTTSGNKFFMLGDQTAYSLMRSTHSASHGNENHLYRTLKQSHTDDRGNVIYIPQLEATSAAVSSFFPLVFDKTVQIDSNSGSRCKYTAYNNGVYLLGSTSSDYLNNNYPGSSDVALYTQSDSYGADFACKFMVINGNLASKPANSSVKCLNLKYAGDNFSRDKGVVVYFTKSISCKKYYGMTVTSTVDYPQGYYFIPISDNSQGVDLFDQSTRNSIQAITNPSTDTHYSNLDGVDLYSEMIDSTGKLKNMHSAYESVSSTSSAPVSFLQSDGKIQMSDSKVCTNAEKTSYYTGWDDYNIYCAPSKMPDASSHKKYVDFYSGEKFNYLWYNINPMEVNSNMKMSIRSRNIVLSIGPDQGETAYYTPNTSFTYPRVFNNTNLESGVLSDPQLKTYTSVNKLVQKDNSASFSVKPYWNESSFILKVMNDFVVERADGSTYNVKAGNYTDIPSSGLNLFSDAAKAYFESHTVTTEESHSSSVNWVMGNTINTAVANDKLDQNGVAVKFEASNGGTLKNGTYKAKAIFCNFGNTVYGNGATLQADVVSIGADKIESNGGKGLFINTYSAYDESKCVLDGSTQVDGSMLQVTSDTDLKLDDGLELTLKEGYYYFPHISGSFNILSSTFWQSWTSTNPYYYTTQLNAPTVYGKETEVIKIAQIVDFEGKYF